MHTHKPLSHDEKVARLRAYAAYMCTTHVWRDARHINTPLTAQMLNEHVAGTARYGLCPITPGNATTHAALLDFDSHKGEVPWETMMSVATRVHTELCEMGGHAIAYRSSGGKGIHLYSLWNTPQDAHDVRSHFTHVLAVCGLTSGTKGVGQGQVEVFPKQDCVPMDGFGNMWVLPFCGLSEQLWK